VKKKLQQKQTLEDVTLERAFLRFTLYDSSRNAGLYPQKANWLGPETRNGIVEGTRRQVNERSKRWIEIADCDRETRERGAPIYTAH
jgi:hypothetical protein